MLSNLYRFFFKSDPLSAAAWFILLFTLLPFILLCIYNVPLGDDFWYAAAYRKHGLVETQILWYNEWSGRYMATFLISTLNPLSYGYINLGFLHCILMFLGTVLSLKFLINNIFDFFKIEISRIFTLSILLFFYLNYIPDLGESFYWMAGAYTYQVPVIFLFIYLGLLLKLFKTTSYFLTNILNLILASICLFVILGSNEVIVVYVCFLNALIAISLLLRNKRQLLKFSPLLIITIVLSVLMIFADGNFARANLFIKPSFHFLKASSQAIFRGLFVLLFWIPTFLLLLLTIPGISKISISEDYIPTSILKNRYTLLILSAIFLVGIVFIGFFPSIYTTNWIPQRAYTPIFAAFIISFTILFILSLKHFQILSQLNAILSGFSKSATFLMSILIIALAQNSNVMNAYVDLTSGKASSYHNQVTNAYNILQKHASDTIHVQELIKRPLILPIRWPQKHNRLANDIWEEYFNVKSVELD